MKAHPQIPYLQTNSGKKTGTPKWLCPIAKQWNVLPPCNCTNPAFWYIEITIYPWLAQPPIADPLELAFLTWVRDPEHEIDDHSQQQYDSQHSRPKTIIEASLTPQSDTLCPPMIREKGVNHSRHGDDSEQEGRDESGPVAKVQHADRESPQDYGEVQPWEKCSLISEENFGFDPGGKSDAFAWIDYQLDCFHDGRILRTGNYRALPEGEVGLTWLRIRYNIVQYGCDKIRYDMIELSIARLWSFIYDARAIGIAMRRMRGRRWSFNDDLGGVTKDGCTFGAQKFYESFLSKAARARTAWERWKKIAPLPGTWT